MAIYARIPYGTDPKGGGRSAFYWPESESKRAELMTVKRGAPTEYQAVYQCNPGAREGQIFLESDFTYYKAGSEYPDLLENLRLGVADPQVAAFIAKGHTVGTGWDTAFEANAAANWSVGIAALMIPCEDYHRGEDPNVFGPCDPHFDVAILDVTRDRVEWAGLVPMFRQFHQLWLPEWHAVEKRGAGIQLYQSMNSVGINVEGIDVREDKRARATNPGVGAGSVQGWFRQHRVILPASAPWLAKYKMEMKDFNGLGDATDDQVDATVHLVNKAIALGANVGLLPKSWTPERVDGNMGVRSDLGFDPTNPLYGNSSERRALEWFGNVDQFVIDPFADACGRCNKFTRNFCTLHNQARVALDSCELWEERVQ